MLFNSDYVTFWKKAIWTLESMVPGDYPEEKSMSETQRFYDVEIIVLV